MTVTRPHCLNYSRVWLAAACLLLSGCGAPAYVPVRGVVTLDGLPVAGAAVTFSPVEPGEASVAVTDADGKFAIKTAHDQVGAVAGKYRVTVFRAEMVKLRPGERSPPGDIALEGHRMEWLVPQQYSRFDTSGLEIEVRPNLPEVKLLLTSEK